MAKWLVRASCEYSLLVDAETEEEALQKANETPKVEWDQAWCQDEVERAEAEEKNG